VAQHSWPWSWRTVSFSNLLLQFVQFDRVLFWKSWHTRSWEASTFIYDGMPMACHTILEPMFTNYDYIACPIFEWEASYRRRKQAPKLPLHGPEIPWASWSDKGGLAGDWCGCQEFLCCTSHWLGLHASSPMVCLRRQSLPCFSGQQEWELLQANLLLYKDWQPLRDPCWIHYSIFRRTITIRNCASLQTD